MKNVCIVLRNQKNGILNPDFSAVADAFLSGGYFLDEVRLLPYDRVGELHAALRGFLADADFVCVCADKVLTEGVRHNLEQTFSLRFAGEGSLVRAERAYLCVLPAGEEGKALVAEKIVPALNEAFAVRYDRMILRMVGAPREKVASAINEAYAVSGDKLDYNYTENFADGRLEVIYDAETPKMLADNVMRVLLSALEEYVYALDDTPLAERVFEGLSLRKSRLSTAESFTGGRVSAAVVRVPGVSSVFYEGLNTYSNESKAARLSVKEDTLRRYGAVSAQTAHEMAEGLFATGGCDVCVATTGIAGPRSDSSKKPVGLCYIAAGINGQIFVNEYVFKGDRECITQTAVNYALFAVFRLLKQ